MLRLGSPDTTSESTSSWESDSSVNSKMVLPFRMDLKAFTHGCSKSVPPVCIPSLSDGSLAHAHRRYESWGFAAGLVNVSPSLEPGVGPPGFRKAHK